MKASMAVVVRKSDELIQVGRIIGNELKMTKEDHEARLRLPMVQAASRW